MVGHTINLTRTLKSYRSSQKFAHVSLHTKSNKTKYTLTHSIHITRENHLVFFVFILLFVRLESCVCWTFFAPYCTRHSHILHAQRQRTLVYFCLHYAFHMDKIVLIVVVVFSVGVLCLLLLLLFFWAHTQNDLKITGKKTVRRLCVDSPFHRRFEFTKQNLL